MQTKDSISAALPVRTALLVLLAAPLFCSCAGRIGPAGAGASVAAAPSTSVKAAGVQYPGRAFPAAAPELRQDSDPASKWDETEDGGLKRDWPMGLFILLIVVAAGAL